MGPHLLSRRHIASLLAAVLAWALLSALNHAVLYPTAYAAHDSRGPCELKGPLIVGRIDNPGPTHLAVSNSDGSCLHSYQNFSVAAAWFDLTGNRLIFLQPVGGGWCQIGHARLDLTDIYVNTNPKAQVDCRVGLITSPYSGVPACFVTYLPAVDPRTKGKAGLYLLCAWSSEPLLLRERKPGEAVVGGAAGGGTIVFLQSTRSGLKLKTTTQLGDGTWSEPTDITGYTDAVGGANSIVPGSLYVSPDGSTVSFFTIEDGVPVFYTMPATGGDPRREGALLTPGGGLTVTRVNSVAYSSNGCIVAVQAQGATDPPTVVLAIRNLCSGSSFVRVYTSCCPFTPTGVGPLFMPADALYRVNNPYSPAAGDPVNLAEGNAHITASDLYVHAAGPSLGVARAYNLADSTRGPLGVGWSLSLEERIEMGRPGEIPSSRQGVTWQEPSGGRLFFQRISGTYKPPPARHEQLGMDSAGRFYLTDTAGTLKTFGSSGRLEKVEDRFNVGYALGYSSDGRLEAVTHTMGPTLRLSYNQDQLLVGVESSDGRSVSYQYTDGLLSLVTKPGGVTESYQYNASGQLESIRDSSGQVIYVQDMVEGAVSRQRDARGFGYSFTYTPGAIPGSGRAQVEDPLGGRENVSWDSNGSETERIDQVGATTTHRYNSAGDRIQTRDARGEVWHTEYNDQGDPILMTDPIGVVSRTEYRKDHQPLSTRDPTGVRTDYVYDERGSVIRVDTPVGSTVLVPNQDGTVSAVISPDGMVSRTEYDSLGRPIRQIDPGGRSSYTIYNPDGTVYKTVSPGGRTTTTLYDQARRPQSVEDSMGNTTFFGYDAAGNQIFVTEPAGQSTHFGYDPAYNLVETSTTIEGGQVIRASYSYDQANRLTQITYPGSTGTATYTYTPNGNLATATDPDGARWSYSYSLRGELTEVISPDGTKTTYLYDPVGRLISQDNTNSGTHTYLYDRAGRLVVAERLGAGRVEYGYDRAGRRVLEKYKMQRGREGEPQEFLVIQTLSPGGRREVLAFGGLEADRQEIFYQWREDGLLGGISSADFFSGQGIFYGYDQDSGRLKAIAYPSSTTAFLSYDPEGRATELTWTLPQGTLAYPTRYDKRGYLTQMGNATYTYDALGRLTGARDELGDTYEYSYDSSSNRTQVKQNGVTTQSLSFEEADKIDTEAHPQFAYDPTGRLISDTTYSSRKRSLFWDGSGRLIAAAIYDPSTGHRQEVRLTYDPTGRLSEKEVFEDATYLKEHHLYYYEADRLLAEEERVSSTFRYYLYGGRDTPAAMKEKKKDGTSTTYFYLTNTHGDVVALQDKDGKIINGYAYGPWGEPKRVSEQVHQHFRYAGYLYDPTTELYYLRARWYDPGTGRFLSRDPLPGSSIHLVSLNRYAYGYCAPPSKRDPSGLSPGCKRGITALANVLDAMARIYVKDLSQGGQWNEFVDAIARVIVGYSKEQLGFIGKLGLLRRPTYGGLQLGPQGWKDFVSDDPNPSRHLMVFVVFGYYDLDRVVWPELYELGQGGTLEDVALGDTGVDLGNRLQLGRDTAGIAGITPYQLGGEIQSLYGSGDCSRLPWLRQTPILGGPSKYLPPGSYDIPPFMSRG
ncbi:MAG: hypothetical protein C4318_01800 [Acidimicrobiia bacterium]